MDEQKRVSLERKLSHFRRHLLLAQVAECYSDDKKAVRALCKIAKRESEALRRSHFPMEEGDMRQLYMSIADLKAILVLFLKARRYDLYRGAGEQLSMYLNTVGQQIEETEASLVTRPTVKSNVQNAIDTAVNKAKELGEAIGKGVERLKKTVTDLGSK